MMQLKKTLMTLFLLVLVAISVPAQSAQADLKPFVPGSYQQLLSGTSNKPFMMVIWSITCSSCLKDMALLNKLHKSQPGLKIIMLATDGVQANPQIQEILQKNELATLEHWNYADENTQKLQFEIDPNWYGEQPRTYFFDKTHQRVGVSGVLTVADYHNHLSKILP